MENIKRLILQNNLISQGDIIGVGVSGGKDSMALLCYLQNLSKELDFEVVAITVDHSIRENGAKDAQFVVDYCKSNNIRVYKFKIDVPLLAKEKSMSLESAAREGRYGVFKTMLQKHVVDKIALAHHKSDQAETVLMHLFRGSGVTGLKGMNVVRDKTFIRPMLNTDEKQIWKYILSNNIPTVEDETNQDNEYSRNLIRNEILPLILKRWPNAINAIINFSNLASEDDDYILSQVPTDAFIVGENEIKIPLTYFLYPNPITSRMIYKALHMIGVNKDIETKHIEIIKNLAKNGENGKRLELPLKVKIFKEYDYITLTNKQKKETQFFAKHKLGTVVVPNFGKIAIKKVNQVQKDENLYYDADKIPKTAIWRFRQNGDVFEKFGGGTKKLKNYLIDKKCPKRIRDCLPVLASGNEIYAIAGMEISNKAKVDEFSKKIYQIKVERN